MRRAGTHLLSAFLVSALARGPAFAAAAPPVLVPLVTHASGPRVVVLVAPLDARAKASAGLLEHAAETAVDAAGRFDLQRGVDALDPTAANARAVKENDAKRLAGDAKKALDELDSAKATQLYGEAVAAWRQADLSRSIDGLVEALAGKAAGHATSGENPAAKGQLEKVLTLAPKTKFSDAQFPPELLKFAESHRRAISNARGKLTVRTDPPGAQVWVDGAYRGASPVTVDSLTKGEHVVAAGLSGYGLALDEAPAGEDLLKLKPAELSFQLQTALEQIAKDPDGPGRDRAARQLGDAARADQVLLLVAKKSSSGDKLDLTGVRLDVKDGHNFSYRAGSAASSGLDEWVAGLVDRDDPRDGKKPVSHFAGGGGAAGSGRRVLGFTLMGGALVAAASWAVFGLSAMGQVQKYDGLLQVEALKSNSAASSGHAFALAADVSWGVGLALLVVGLVLVITGAGGGGSAGASSAGSSAGAKPAPKEDDTLREYRRHQEEEKRRLEEEQQQKEEPAQQQPPPTQPQPPPEEEKKEPAPPPPEEKKEEKKEKEKELTPAEKKKLEREEKKRKAAEEKERKKQEREDKKRKAEEEKAEKRKAEEEKKRAEEEKGKSEEEKKAAAEERKKKAEEEKAKADEEKKKADEEKKRKADEEKAKAEEEKKKAEEDKKAAAEEKKRKAEEEKAKAEEEKKAAEEEKKHKADDDKQRAEAAKRDEQQRKADEEAKKADEERRKKEYEKRRQEDEKVRQSDPKKDEKKKSEEDDLRNF